MSATPRPCPARAPALVTALAPEATNPDPARAEVSATPSTRSEHTCRSRTHLYISSLRVPFQSGAQAGTTPYPECPRSASRRCLAGMDVPGHVRDRQPACIRAIVEMRSSQRQGVVMTTSHRRLRLLTFVTAMGLLLLGPVTIASNPAAAEGSGGREACVASGGVWVTPHSPTGSAGGARCDYSEQACTAANGVWTPGNAPEALGSCDTSAVGEGSGHDRAARSTARRPAARLAAFG